MRFARTSLLARVAPGAAAGLVVLEAPAGYGKSWIARRATGSGALRCRGDVSVLNRPVDDGAAVVIDDAHLLAASDIERLLEFIEDHADRVRCFVAGRYLPDAVHEVAHLVDGLVVDTASLAITSDEIVEAVPTLSSSTARRITEAANGAVRTISTVLDQLGHQPDADPVALAQQVVRSTSAAVLQRLDTADRELVTLLARTAITDRQMLDKLGGPGFVARAVAAGVPFRRQIAGGIELAGPAGFRAQAIDPAGAVRLAGELVNRGRPIEAVVLLLDSGAHERASTVLAELPDSIVDTIPPRTLLTLIARLGASVDSDPALLRTRAAISTRNGRLDLARQDLERALTVATDGQMRRRLLAEYSEQLWFGGDGAEAERVASEALRNLGPGEDRTFAFAHGVLGEVAQAADNREGLQRAAEEFRLAVASWEACGELAKARRCRLNLASGVFVPLGQFEEALSQIGQLLSVTDLSDTERAWTMVFEGFVLCNANRLEAAEAHFARVHDIAQIIDSPQVKATVAWGRALVASRRDDAAGTLRWASIAENTALGENDDLLGVPFLCDMATAFGALGELDLAERYLTRARERGELFPSQVRFAEFVQAARMGKVGDVDEQLAHTQPVEWWRVRLVSALATANAGDAATAERLLVEAERDLIGLGFGSFRDLGERRTFDEVQRILAERLGPGARAHADSRHAAGRRLRVIGGPMAVVGPDGVEEIPPGNPQRLVGAVVANGGAATFDQLSEAIWPGEDVDTSRTRLRNVLMRLRRGSGELVVRSGSGVRLAADVTCDLHDFERLATDALSAARSDPELAGHLAADAIRLVEGQIFEDFEYEEWAVSARRSGEQQLIGLLDLLSVQAEDAGDLPLAQSLAERALRLDRYSDSRYVRIAELLTLQGRNAAAVAVLRDAAEVALEVGGALPSSVAARREELIRQAATGS
jgi:DNA-binding SARP family transcriptional activator